MVTADTCLIPRSACSPSTTENLTDPQQARLALIARRNEPPYRAYLLEEQLRAVVRLKGHRGKRLLES
jgi:hypothetical protein